MRSFFISFESVDFTSIILTRIPLFFHINPNNHSLEQDCFSNCLRWAPPNSGFPFESITRGFLLLHIPLFSATCCSVIYLPLCCFNAALSCEFHAAVCSRSARPPISRRRSVLENVPKRRSDSSLWSRWLWQPQHGLVDYSPLQTCFFLPDKSKN